MSDRYYSQMAKAVKMTEGELKQHMKTDEGKAKLEKKIEKLSNAMPKLNTGKKPTKRDYSNQICTDLGITADLSKANLESLWLISEAIKTKKVITMLCPEGRLKRPYIETLVEMFPNIKEDGIEQLTVANMKALIEGVLEWKSQ